MVFVNEQDPKDRPGANLAAHLDQADPSSFAPPPDPTDIDPRDSQRRYLSKEEREAHPLITELASASEVWGCPHCRLVSMVRPAQTAGMEAIYCNFCRTLTEASNEAYVQKSLRN